MFVGEFPYKLDAKGRVPIPPRFRRELQDGIVLAPGAEKCIAAYSIPEWQKMSEAITAGSFTPSKLRRLNRAMFAGAFPVAFDRQGRVPLPAPLRKYAGINDDVVVAGCNNYLELWDRQEWEAEKATSQEQVWQIIESQEKR